MRASKNWIKNLRTKARNFPVIRTSPASRGSARKAVQSF